MINIIKGSAIGMSIIALDDDVMPWKRIPPALLSFVRGIHRSLVGSLHDGPIMRSFGVLFILTLKKMLYI